MQTNKFYKIVVFVPLDFTDKVREAIAKAGGGKIGNYSACTFSSRGVGRYLPEKGANPAIGKIGHYETVQEERIEVGCEKEIVKSVIEAIKEAHPYEEVALDVYELVDL